MLKITVRDFPDRLRLELEGALAGAWVPELEASWRNANQALGGRELWIDLCGVDRIDAAGKYLLALMHSSGARICASGCLMEALVGQITNSWPCGPRTATRTS